MPVEEYEWPGLDRIGIIGGAADQMLGGTDRDAGARRRGHDRARRLTQGRGRREHGTEARHRGAAQKCPALQPRGTILVRHAALLQSMLARCSLAGTFASTGLRL